MAPRWQETHRGGNNGGDKSNHPISDELKDEEGKIDRDKIIGADTNGGDKSDDPKSDEPKVEGFRSTKMEDDESNKREEPEQ
ncbi:uncharacterized protein G2W53_039334 [Senna tora]|uniref:Uncharacterized protein n=1 Tax=Senna tora TaxID=362788 RepID=A0A834SMJ0_9FABA|nr:uncharacterized protein G2W53_039334 [Senna tora]